MNNKPEYNQVKLFELLTSRMLHDIASSVGIIDTCFSISNEGKNIVKANELLQKEIKNMGYKLNFFRNIYATAYEEDSMKVTCFTKLLSDFFYCKKIKLNLHFSKEITEINFTVAKISLLLVTIAAEAVNFNGTIDVFIHDQDNKKVKIVTEIIINNKNNNKTEFINKFREVTDKCPLTIKNCYEYYINNLCAANAYRINIANEKPEFLKYFLEKVN